MSLTVISSLHDRKHALRVDEGVGVVAGTVAGEAGVGRASADRVP